jgi:hypothetical protein
MVAMSEPQAVGDLVAAVADALRGDRGSLSRIVDNAKERTRERLLDALAPAAPDPKRPVPGPAPAARSMPRPAPDREIEIRLRSGRRLRARIAPAVARRQDLVAVARVSADNTRRAFDTLRRHRGAIAGLKQSNEDLAKKVSTLEQRGDLELVGLLQGFASLQRQVRDVGARTQAIAVAAGVPAPTRPMEPPPRQPSGPRQQLGEMRELQRLALRSQIQSATTVVNTVQAAAYGERGSIFATNNLLLAGNQLFWSLLDPVLERAGVLNAASATIFAALAPIGTLLTGEVLLGDRQHVRFISGVTTVPTNGDVVSESLRGRVAEGAWPAFRDRTDVPVTAAVTDPPGFSASNVLIRVSQGAVEIAVPPSPVTGIAFIRVVPSIRVAWTVDTGAGDV